VAVRVMARVVAQTTGVRGTARAPTTREAEEIMTVRDQLGTITTDMMVRQTLIVAESKPCMPQTSSMTRSQTVLLRMIWPEKSPRGSTHYNHTGDSDRVVLGKYDGQDGGYIGEARHHGGIYFDTGNDVWNAVEHGLDSGQAQILGWQVNEQFLRSQMEDSVSRIEYVLPDGFDSVDQVARVRRESFSAMEINFLNEHAAGYGYVRDGNSWVFRGDQ
jgi:hypothetical protein